MQGRRYVVDKNVNLRAVSQASERHGYMGKLSEIARPVSAELAEFQRYYRAVQEGVPSHALRVILWYVLRRPGKQVRPLLVYLSASACGGVRESTKVAAAMIEIVHNASLLHDDVVDDSALRRGAPSVYRLWKAKGTVLAGDYMLAEGLRLAVDTGEYRLLDLMNEAVQKMSLGELNQLRNARRNEYSVAEYFKVISGKTAALLAASAAAGAFSAGADDATVEQFKRFGERLGMAFQVRDDMLDFSTSSAVGKSVGNDLQEGKFTLPVIYALESLEGRERKATVSQLRRARGDARVRSEVARFIAESGAMQRTAAMVRQFVEEGKSALLVVPDSEAKRSLFALADYLVERTK